MDRVVRKHLGVIIGVSALCIATSALLLGLVHDSAATLSANAFSMLVFIVPCALMLVGSFAIALTANEIGRQLYLVILAICLACGIVAMAVTSGWLSDADIAAKLLANSEEGTVITPILKSPITILRDIAAFIVVPTVGSIFGAWLGSRLHPLRADKPARKKR